MASLLQRKTQQELERKSQKPVPIEQWLNEGKDHPERFKTIFGRLLDKFGEPNIIDTSKVMGMSRVFSNKEIVTYPAFAEFYGMEDVVMQISSYLKHADQGLEESRQVLYLLGPVGGGKSSVAEKFKSLAEETPFYRLCVKTGEKDDDGNDIFVSSPVNDNPLCLFSKKEAKAFEEEYGIPARYIHLRIRSGWVSKRLQELNYDYSQFYVEEVYPDQLERVGIAKTEPADENNQDITALVGKVDIRNLELYDAADPDAYSYTGSLNRANQGVMEFVEMFKAPLKVLNPILTATQEKNYNPVENGPAIPFEGMILAHSNESEWTKFRNNKDNEAFLDRVYVVKIPYCLRVSEEKKIYEKLLSTSSLADAPCAPGTLETLAQWSVLTRLEDPDTSTIYSKMRVYNGEDLRETDPKAKSYREYRSMATSQEGMSGSSTRFAFKVLSAVFNKDMQEVAANPVHLFEVLEDKIKKENLPQEVEDVWVQDYLKGMLVPLYAKFLGKEIEAATLNSFNEYGQNMFDRYVTYADFWLQDQEYRNPETGQLYDRAALNKELEAIEMPAGISNPKDFRNEIVNYVLRVRADGNGSNPDWTGYEKIAAVIRMSINAKTEDLLPVISFSATKEDDQKKHDDYVSEMKKKGYTERQIRILSEWYLRLKVAK